MLEIKNIDENEYTESIHKDIIEYYKKGKLLLSDQVLKWYEADGKIRDCIDNTMYKLGYTKKKLNYKLVEYLLNKEIDKLLKVIAEYKLKYNVIPMYVCKYIIYCIIEFNQFTNIKECVLCDFATNIENENGIYNVLNYVEENNEIFQSYGVFEGYEGYLKLQEELIKNFSKNNLRIIDTLYHEIEHSIQYRDIENKNFIGNRYYMYIEDIISKKIKNYYRLNYYEKYKEIEARKAGTIGLNNLLDELNIDKNTCYIYNEISVVDYINNRIEECDNLLKNANMKYINESEKKDIIELWNTYQAEQ